MQKILYEQPKLIAIAGPPAVGKSAIAHELGRRIACAYLRRGHTILDVFDELEAATVREAASNPKYKRRADIAFEIFYRFAEENLGLGSTVLLDTPFNDIRWGQKDGRLDGIVEKYDSDFRLFICTAPDSVIRQRMTTRENGHPRPTDKAKLADWGRYATRMHRTGDVKYPFIVVDTTLPVEANVNLMLESLSW